MSSSLIAACVALGACSLDEPAGPGSAAARAELGTGVGQVGPSVNGAVIELAGAAVEVHTAAVWRGTTALDVDLVAAEATPELAILVRACLVETVQRAAGGVEQSWRFERAPGAAGDLIIAVAATGLAYVGADAAGLQLRQPGGVEVRYGHGTWIDAKGTRWAIPARYDQGRILLVVPAAVLAASSFPAVLDPQIIVTPILT